LNKTYFKVAVPTGLAVAAASLVQAIAYNYDASPTKQAFLENLSCVIVPILMLLIVKKKPSVITAVAALVCLASSFVLGDIFSVGLSVGAADILNALAGVFYGVNIAFTGIYAKKLDAKLYVMIQLFVQAILSAIMAVAFNFINIGGTPIDPFVFTPKAWLILAIIGIGIVSGALCWTVRTSAMKYVSANVVAIIMPFSAVITGVFALILGQDEPSITLLIGAILGLAASFMSSAGDILENKRKEKTDEI
jgi:drug/metabolite transporter (DMT)-like permease